MQKLDEAREKLAEANKDFDNVRRKAKQAKMNFERVKQERYDLFMKCFEHVSNTIDGIYKNLARNQSAQVDLMGIQAKTLEVMFRLSLVPRTQRSPTWRGSTTTAWRQARGSSPCPTFLVGRKQSQLSLSSSPSTLSSQHPSLCWMR